MDMKKFIQIMLFSLAAAVVVELVLNHFSQNKHKAAVEAAKLVANTTNATPLAVTKNAVPPQIITLGSAVAGQPYKLALQINTAGAGIEEVQLNASDYRETESSKTGLVLLRARKDCPLPFSTRYIIAGGHAYDARNLVWRAKTKGRTPTQVTLEYTIALNSKELFTLDKTFRINPKTYNVTITSSIKNQSAVPLKIAIDQLGPESLPLQDVQSDMRLFMSVGYRGKSRYLDTTGFPQVYQSAMAGANVAPVKLGSFIGEDHLLWVAATNRFFTAIVRPQPNVGEKIKYDALDSGARIPQTSSLGQAFVKRVGPDATEESPTAVAAIVLDGEPQTVAAGQSVQMPLAVYFGPKKRAILAGSGSAPPQSEAYNFHLYQYLSVIEFNQGSYCSFCTFSWLAMVILKVLDWIHMLVPNYGAAIIILVIAVRLLLHPLTRYGQISMTRMQRQMAKLQPELEKIKTRYAKDPAKLREAQMALYKDHNVNPAASVLGCLPMILQMPIWIALYSGLAVDIDLRQAVAIPGWLTDLSNPDTIAHWQTSFHVPVLGYMLHGQSFIALNLLPILLGFVFFAQMRFQMRLAPPPTDPQQRQTQMISQYMILLFPLFLYNAPSGLNLYICASTIGGLLDTWLVRRHLKKLDAKQAAAA